MAFIYETADCADYNLLKDFAKKNRLHPTLAENVLWDAIKSEQIGYKFRRQHIIGNYIADFVCLRHKLIIEVDGIYHFRDDQPVKDEDRTIDLASLGFHVIRFTNDEIMGNIDDVASRIKDKIMKTEASPQPSTKEEKEKTISSAIPEKGENHAQGSFLPPLSGRAGERLSGEGFLFSRASLTRTSLPSGSGYRVASLHRASATTSYTGWLRICAISRITMRS